MTSVLWAGYPALLDRLGDANPVLAAIAFQLFPIAQASTNDPLLGRRPVQ